MEKITMEKLVAYCKQYGFIFQGSDALSSQKYHPSTDAFAFYLYNLTINGQLRHNVTTSNYIQSMVNNTNTDGYKSSYRTGSQYALKRGFYGGYFQHCCGEHTL